MLKQNDTRGRTFDRIQRRAFTGKRFRGVLLRSQAIEICDRSKTNIRTFVKRPITSKSLVLVSLRRSRYDTVRLCIPRYSVVSYHHSVI